MHKMKLAATQELFSYWNRLRGERRAPDRADIEPGAIRGVLADTFVLDISAEDRFPFRIVGARVNALFVCELKSADFLKMWNLESGSSIREFVETVAEEPCPAVAGVQASPPGRAALDMEMLLLPLRHFGKTRMRVLGALTPASVPSWLGLVPVTGLDLGPMRVLRRSGDVSGSSHWGKHHETAARHGHLRVHEGGHSSFSSIIEDRR